MPEQTYLVPTEVKSHEDRRRPGRIDVAETLLPLLRDPAAAHPFLGHQQDSLSPAKGILTAALFSAPIWLLILRQVL